MIDCPRPSHNHSGSIPCMIHLLFPFNLVDSDRNHHGRFPEGPWRLRSTRVVDRNCNDHHFCPLIITGQTSSTSCCWRSSYRIIGGRDGGTTTTRQGGLISTRRASQ